MHFRKDAAIKDASEESILIKFASSVLGEKYVKVSTKAIKIYLVGQCHACVLRI